MKLMIVTPYYPPIFTAGGTRIFEMVKYFSTKPEIERIDVLVWNPYLDLDIDKIPKLDKVNIWPSKFGSFFPDVLLKHQDSNPFYLWSWHSQTRKFGKKIDPDIVLFTSPPGVILSGTKWCRSAGVDYIIDYRDDWMTANRHIINGVGGLMGKFALWTHKMTERIARKAHEEAHLITTVHNDIASGMGIGDLKIVEVRNGIVLSDVEAILSNSDRPQFLDENVRYIVYVGHLLASSYSPEIVMPLLKNIPDSKLLIFTSKVTEEFDKKVEDAGVRDMVMYLNEPFDKMLSIISKCDMGMIFIQEGVPQTSYAIPSKLYDYISIGLPILIIADDYSFAYRFIKKYGNGIALKWNELDMLADSIKILLDDKTYKEIAQALVPKFMNMFDRNKQYEILYQKLLEVRSR